MKGLSIAEIRALQAKKKGSKGIYEEKLYFLMFLSDEPGVNVAESWPEAFTVVNPETGERESKQANTLYQGFVGAAKKLQVEDKVDIMNREGQVYIMVLSRIEEADSANGNAEESNGEAEVELVEA